MVEHARRPTTARGRGRRALLALLIVVLLLINGVLTYMVFVQLPEERDKEVYDLGSHIQNLESEKQNWLEERALRKWLDGIPILVTGSEPDGVYYSDDTHSTPTTITLKFTAPRNGGVACPVHVNSTLSGRDGSIVQSTIRLGPEDLQGDYKMVKDSMDLRIGRHTLTMVAWCKGWPTGIEIVRETSFDVPPDRVPPTVFPVSARKDGGELKVQAKVSDNIGIRSVTVTVWLVNQNGTLRIADNQNMTLIPGSDLYEFSFQMLQGPIAHGQIVFLVTAIDTSNNQYQRIQIESFDVL